jgi:phytoene dehydrogenase-like protein
MNAAADDAYDVVIVGAGHNGLVAGTYLARSGLRVLLIERAAEAGGMSTSSHAIPEAPGHMINTGTAELIHIRANTIVQELDLVRHGYRTVETDPTYAYLAPDGSSIALFRDPRRTADDIGRLSAADAKAYLDFMALIDALMDIAGPMNRGDPSRRKPKDLIDLGLAAIRNRRLRSELQVLQAATADQIACERFEHPATQALMLGIVVGAGPIDIDGNAIAYALFGLLHRVGVSKAVGGMRMLANALTASYAEAGGTLLLGAPVDEIIIEDGRARGVRLADGRVFRAEAVIATCDPRTTLGLATPGGVPRRMAQRLEHAPANRANIGASVLNVALDRPLKLRRHQELRHDDANLNTAVGLIGTAEEVRRSLAAARRAEVTDAPTFSVSPMSNWDPSQAPDGQSTAYIYMPTFPVELRGGWEGRKTAIADSVLARAAEYYEGLDGEIGRLFETCLDRAERLNVTNGCVTHVDFGAYRSGARRPAPGFGDADPVVAGLYLGGAGSHPGGGVSGLPGKLAAERVQARLARSAQR